VVCALPPRGEQRLLDLCTANGLPARRIGTVGGSSLDIDGVGAIDLDELRAAHEGTLPARFG
jgi:phosphoribosylformylglycinamidine synthase